MKDPDLERIIEQDHRASTAFCNGDPVPKLALYSRADDATLANPLGPPALGWQQVLAAAEAAASVLRDGEPTRFERISECETADLAYILEIERTRVKIAGADAASPVALRVTTVFRRESAGWKVAHRHADPVTESRQARSITDG
jgi:ketosteroid isomerase-like protein